MKNKILLILAALILSSCQNQSSQDKNHFQSFIKHLKPVETPISFNSKKRTEFEPYPLKDSLFFDQIQKKYDGFVVFGLLFKTKDFIAILGYLPTATGSPFIITFNEKGDEIDSHLVYENVLEDMGIYKNNFVTIYPNFQIDYKDSTIRRKINAEGTNEIPGTDSLTVKLRKYKIDQNGKFIITE